MTKKIYFVTSNAQKVHSLQRRLKDLAYEIVPVNLEIDEIQRDSIREIAVAKAKAAYTQLNAPLIVNDSGLVIDALNNFPGPYTKYVVNTIGNSGILKLLENQSNRNAYTTQTLVYINEQAQKYVFEDRVYGTIACQEATVKTDNSWGKIWNIFIPKSARDVRAALSEEEYDECRKHAQENSVWESLYEVLLKAEDENEI